MALWDSVEEKTLHPGDTEGMVTLWLGRGRLPSVGPWARREALATPATPGPAWEATSVLLPLSWALAAVGICWQWSPEMAGLARELQGSQKLWSQRQMARGLQRAAGLEKEPPS